MELRLELVPVPVRDVEQARAFYTEQLGFRIDHDVQPTRAVRVVHLTPPGSACGIVLATGLPALQAEPGSVRGLHLTVDDIAQARRRLVARGVAVDEIDDLGSMLYAGFRDPDGNSWTLQQHADTLVGRSVDGATG
jgi:catechol 2,3-dioxygenase-like lactoylglutathione lyase family enzyme